MTVFYRKYRSWSVKNTPDTRYRFLSTPAANDLIVYTKRTTMTTTSCFPAAGPRELNSVRFDYGCPAFGRPKIMMTAAAAATMYAARNCRTPARQGALHSLAGRRRAGGPPRRWPVRRVFPRRPAQRPTEPAADRAAPRAPGAVSRKRVGFFLFFLLFFFS